VRLDLRKRKNRSSHDSANVSRGSCWHGQSAALSVLRGVATRATRAVPHRVDCLVSAWRGSAARPAIELDVCRKCAGMTGSNRVLTFPPRSVSRSTKPVRAR
jgi:hypothetical protein